MKEIIGYAVLIWMFSMMVIGVRLFSLLAVQKKSFFGKPFLNPFVFYTGKLALVGTWFTAFLEAIGITNNYAYHWAPLIIFVLIVLSWILIFPAQWNLGTRLKPGIPEEKTVLETSGLYKYTRHPLYLGAYFFGLASLLYAPSWYNALFFTLMVVIHYFIVVEEEKFLARTFKEEWESYASKTPKYLF